ncbi:MAG: 2-oxoacid:acceptor oxidoreductase subunit alpha [Desulfurococcales archaeon]|nr:2-oxoacid:acceptor oxidoreductase subunit alpha [Desulfurococcales archaeon]
MVPLGYKELYLLLGGPQGAGLETSSYILTSSLARRGYGVVSDREYFSNIVGRHSYIHMTISAERLPMYLTYPVKLVGAMDAESVFTHFSDLEEGGWLVYDTGTDNMRLLQIPSMENELKERLRGFFRENGIEERVESVVRFLREERNVNVVGLSFKAILNVLRQKYNMSLGQAQRFRSSILVGAVGGLMGINPDLLAFGIERRFAGREKLVEMNRFLVERLAEEVSEEYGTPLKLDEPSTSLKETLIVSGNEIVGMGKIVGGIRYQSYYPITPAADESVFLEAHEGLKIDGNVLGSIVVFQTEDEIAAITSAIGAALAGARSATATSGPGFSLMVEALGWAGINETPVVVTYYQRGGPSTGQPTRGSQSDLLFSMFASHGEFPRIVLASGDHMEAFYDAINAFNYAEKYQLPVIHLLDKFLANSIATVPLPDFSRIEIDRGKILVKAPQGAFKRFDKSEPISPRPILGSGAVTWYTGDEHDEWGHIVEDPVNRVEMYEKRMKKLEIADKEIPVDERVKLYGDRGSDFILVGWGFVKGIALEALRELRSQGYNGAYMHIRMFIPFPSSYVEDILSEYKNDRIIAVEHNILAQAAKVVTMNTGVKINKYILKYTGRPMYKMELVSAVKSILDEGRDKVVLTYGQ